MFNINLFLKKFFILTALIAGIFLMGFWPGEAYAPEPTHVALVEATAKLYNQFNEERLTSEEIEWLKKGAIEEDTAPRWLNHFYDPTTDLGWSGKNIMEIGYELPPSLTLFVQSILIGGRVRSSVDWADNREAQAEYEDYLGDQAWTKAVQFYALGDRQSAFIAMGHILHLVQDMTVPAHTRQDTHSDAGLGDGDPYESWLKISRENSEVKNFDRVVKDYPSFQCGDIKNCLKQLAAYSNHYFFSKDTIDNEYQYPKVLFYKKEIIDGLDVNFAYGKDESNQNFRLAVFKHNNLTIDDNDFLNSDYYSRLSKQAIMGGAKVIELFKEQADKMSEEEAKNQPIVKTGKKLFSFLGDYLKIKPKVDGFMSEVAAAGKVILAFYRQKAEMENFAAEKAVDLLYGLDSKKNFDLGVAIDEPPLPEDRAIAVSPSTQVILPPNIIETLASTRQNFSENLGEQEIIHEPYESPKEIKSFVMPEQSSVIPAEAGIQNKDKIPVSMTETDLDSRFHGNDNESNNNDLIVNTNQSDPGGALPWLLSYGAPAANPAVITGEPENNSSEPPTDTTAPDIEIGLKNYKLTSLTFTVFWQSSSTDIGYYEAQRKKSGDELWTEWVNNSSSTEQIFEASADNKIYQFKVRAVDLAGNKSDWANAEAEISTKPVIINEIAWMGTGASSQLNKDEWIELYNKSNQNLNLDGWSLAGGNGGPNITFASTSIIAAKSYFLIERSDDDAVSNIAADFIANFSNGLNDEGEELVLKNQNGEIIDALPDGDWFSGHKDSRQTMERINPYLSAELSNNWQTNDGITKNGLAADGEILINGTPTAANSVFNPDYAIPNYSWSKMKIIDSAYSPAYVATPSIALDNQNNPHLIYRSASGGNPADVIYNFYDGASWQTKYASYSRVNSFDLQAQVASPSPHLALDADNQPSVIFTAGIPNQYRLYFNNLEGSNWETSLNLSGTSTQAYFSALAIGDDGRLHTVWETTSPDYEIYYRFFDSSAGWSEITQVSSSSDMTVSPALAMDQNNNPHLVWFEYNKIGIGGKGFYYSTLTADTWTEPERIFNYQGLGITHSDSPSLIIDKNDVLHAAWSDIKNTGDKGDIYYSRKTEGGWLAPINVSQSTSTQSRLPHLIVDNKNQLHLVWSETVGGKEQIFYTYSDESQDIWEAPKKIFSDTARSFVGAQLSAGSDGRLHLVWSSYGQNPSGIYYSHTEP